MPKPFVSTRSPRETVSSDIVQRYERIRSVTKELADPLSPEDCAVQSMPDASPVKWHLAHTTWFFETFILAKTGDYASFDESYAFLFNSYYNAVGRQYPRPSRGMLTRPSFGDIERYRQHVDEAMLGLLAAGDLDDAATDLVELGLNHEQQHQELILTDVKHLLSANPLAPKYYNRWPLKGICPGDPAWRSFKGGLCEIGAAGDGFHFDNEAPRHAVWLDDFEMSALVATNAQFLEFIEDGGYARPELWLDAGWAAAEANGWRAPLYWRETDEGWRAFTLHGEVPIDPHAPVCHVSFYEADAFARWMGARLPTEAEWELASRRQPIAGNFLESGVLHPLALRSQVRSGELAQAFGDVWEWTRSDYGPYPGFRPASGAVGEYNGKFMSGQYVLRGGSCATPADHIRATYRNFFPPDARWQFSGVRLARDAAGGARRPRAPLGAPAASFVAAVKDEPAKAAAELTRGLAGDPAAISSKYFYDLIGSELFETITRLPEYYLPGAEAEIFDRHGGDIAAAVRAALGPDFQIVDLGAGNCEKAEKLLPAFSPSRYLAIDISSTFLENAVNRLQARFPAIPMVGVGMDFSERFELPGHLSDRPTLVFFPGSSLGNFDQARARRLLAAARAAAEKSALLLGADLVKDRRTLEAAYDDATGVTAAFNLNILRHANRIAGADFDPALWRHVAFYNAKHSRIEMHLEAKRDQIVRWRGGQRRFAMGDRILTEYSRKWRREDIEADLREAGFSATKIWTDVGVRFATALGVP